MNGAMAKPAKARSLAPKEHGAYAQLGLPIVAALVAGRPSWAAALFACGAAAAFAANEPMMILLGRRGARAAREEHPRAVRALAVLGLAALLCFGVGAFLGGRAVVLAAMVPLAIAPVLAIAIALRVEKTTIGEIVAAAALSSSAVPIAVAAQVPFAMALTVWASWLVAFGSATSAVRGVIAHRKRPVSRAARLGSVLAAPVLAAAAILSGALPASVLFSAAPVVLAGIVLAAAPPHPRALTRIGWMLVVASIATTALLARTAWI